MPIITVVTYTYNRANFLSKVIESVLSQSFTDFEYIIINNGSTDNTEDVLKQYSEKDNRIFIITRPVNDISSENFLLFKSLIKERKTKFYIQIDDDDYIEPNTIETLYKLINESDYDIAVVGSKWIFPDKSIIDKYVYSGKYCYTRIEAMKELLIRNRFNSAQGGKLYKKSLLDNINVPYVNHFRDIYREYRIINNIKKMIATGEPLYYFYRHDSNVSGLDTKEQITPGRMAEHLEANKMRTDWLTEHMPEIKDFVFYSELSFMISLFERIYRLEVKDCFEIANEMKTTLLSHKDFLSNCGFCKEKEKEILENIYE